MQTRVLFDVARIHVDIFICGLSVSAIHRSLVPLLACNARRGAGAGARQASCRPILFARLPPPQRTLTCANVKVKYCFKHFSIK